MIYFPNGHSTDFFVASGALGFRGDGWWWEVPFQWLGVLNPTPFVIITKSLTVQPREGNLRHYCPWRAVRFIRNGVVNCVGLSNPGIDYWVNKCYDHVCRRKYKVMVSIAPMNPGDGVIMARKLNPLQELVGIQVNSCPNIRYDSDDPVERICTATEEVLQNTRHPVSVKLGVQDPYLEIARRLCGRVTIEVINSVPWEMVFPADEPSPLESYGYKGAVSGRVIIPYARAALSTLKMHGISNVASGGGITDMAEIKDRFNRKADAVVIGTAVMKPWKLNQLHNQWTRHQRQRGLKDATHS